jgi:hypothetical protein
MALAVASALLAPVAHAAITGNIAGRVTDQATGKPLAGVTVTITSPALQGEQTEFTDSSGSYIVTELPPGEYTVRFYYANIKVERAGVFLNADKTLPVNAAIPTQKAATQTYRIVEKAPSVDVANTQVQTQITSELVRQTPFGRNYNSILTLAPGAATDPVGFSFGGASGPENNFLIDGANATNPAFGLLGTNLSLEFIKETEIITAGYAAEYGRATGGVVNAITKSGSNQFHGGAWFFYTPFQLTPPRVGRIGEAIVSTSSIPNPFAVGNGGRIKNAFDFGFDLGGPILKDKIWFYVGFTPQFQTNTVDRIVRTRLSNDIATDTANGGTGDYLGDLDTSQKCPKWIDQRLCPPVPGFATRDVRSKSLDYSNQVYQYIGKLNFQLSQDHALILQYIGTTNENQFLGTLNGNTESGTRTRELTTHDANVRLISKFLDRKLQLDILGAYHGEIRNPSVLSDRSVDPTQTQDLRTVSLGIYNQYEGSLPECQVQRDINVNGTLRNFNPCPVTNYTYGGIGFNNRLRNHRGSVQIGLTYFLRAGGTHAIKFGFDFEDNIYLDDRFYTGDGIFEIRRSGLVRRTQFGAKLNDGTAELRQAGFNATTSTTNESFYLRDSWNVGFVPGLTVNAGVRWELQQVRDINGNIVIGIPDNVAPRVGLIYDFTKKGLSKLYASYGRFYESIPLDINDRQFSGEGIAIQRSIGSSNPLTNCTAQGNPPTGYVDIHNCNFGQVQPGNVNGGTYALVAPILRGQYINDVVAGIQYDVGLDIVLGAAYNYRSIGRIIEDLSTDGGITYIIGNPGEKTDPGTVSRLENQIRTLENQIQQTPPGSQRDALVAQRNDRRDTLSRYLGVASFPAPRRTYQALILTATKRFSRNFSVLASYTFSRTYGNYGGTFSQSNGQLDPNISSQYDLRELLVNRGGPLPNDRPHNLKITGNYSVPVPGGGINFGVNFYAQSGIPIQVLAAHPIYGRMESYLLPSGSGGRTPFITNFDLRLAYFHQFNHGVRFEATWEIFNLFNQRKALLVDDEYTTDQVLPTQFGRPSDVRRLRDSVTGAPLRVNPNYGQPLTYQAPLSMRFGVRVSF